MTRQVWVTSEHEASVFIDSKMLVAFQATLMQGQTRLLWSQFWYVLSWGMAVCGRKKKEKERKTKKEIITRKNFN